MPVILAPAGLARLVHPQGELAVARAAGRRRDRSSASRPRRATRSRRSPTSRPGRSGCSSTSGAAPRSSRGSSSGHGRRATTRSCSRSTCRWSATASATCGTAPRCRPASTSTRRSTRCGGRAGCVDFVRGSTITFANLAEIVGSGDPGAIGAYVDRELNDPSATWERLDWLRRLWDGPLVVKGVLSAHDAVEAVRRGADAVYVSNHGGRQLDGSPATLDVAAGDRRGGRRPGRGAARRRRPARARTSSRRARSAPARASSAARGSWRSQPRASPASRACSS